MRDRLLRLVWVPAEVAGRFRPLLQRSVARDAATDGGTARRAFAVLATLAVAYPVAASFAHAFGGPTPFGDSLALALRPAFDVVYAESIPFMLAAIGIGLVSPALGVLFLAVFIPADLLAAFASNELENYTFQELPPGAAYLGRFSSYGLLWILAVEIPLQTGGLVGRWERAPNRAASRARLALLSAAIVAFLVWLWATAVPLLITPVFTWSGLQILTRLATDPTWYYWPLLVVAAASLAGLASVWPDRDSVVPAPPERAPLDMAPEGARVARQFAGALLTALLLLGLMTGLSEAIVVVGGLLVAGPGLTLVLPKLPAPEFLRTSGPVRGYVSMAIVLAGAALVTIAVGDGMFSTDYLPFAGLVVGSIIAFRVLLDAGVGPAARPGIAAVPPRAPGEAGS